MLFGGDFRGYLGTIPNSWRIQQEGETDTLGENEAHRRDLEAIFKNHPDGLWTPTAVDLLGRFKMHSRLSPDIRTEVYKQGVQRYPNSPYTARWMQQIGHAYAEAAQRDDQFDALARAAFEDLRKRFANSDYSPEAFRYLAESDKRKGDLPAAHEHAKRWVESAPVYDKLFAWAFLADLWQEEKNPQEMQKAIQKTHEAVKAFRQARNSGSLTISEQRSANIEQAAGAIEKHLAEMK